MAEGKYLRDTVLGFASNCSPDNVSRKIIIDALICKSKIRI